jgi:DNA primase
MAIETNKENVMAAIASLGYQVFRNGSFHFNSKSTPDMLINNNGSIHCWTASPFKSGGSNHGDLIDFIMLISNKAFKEAKNEAYGLLNLPIPALDSYEDGGFSCSTGEKKSGFISEDFIANFEQERKLHFKRYNFLLQETLPSLNAELRKKVALKYKIGYSKKADRLIMPIRDEQGRCVTLWKYNKNPKTFKNEQGKVITPSKVTFTKGRKRCPFNLSDMSKYREDKSKWIFLCAGEKDTLNAIGNGYRAITLGAENVLVPEEYLYLFKDMKIVIVYDYDKAGFEGSQKIKNQLLGIEKQKDGSFVFDPNKKIVADIKVWDWEMLKMQNSSLALFKGYDMTDWLYKINKQINTPLALAK